MRTLAITCEAWAPLEVAKEIILEYGFTPCKVISIYGVNNEHFQYIVNYKILFEIKDDEDKLAAFLKFPHGSLEEYKSQ